jgi:hypothetical protein
MAQRYQILFQCELLAGFDSAQARADTARLFNVGPAQIAQIFSGRQVGIHKNLSAAEAARYCSTLSHIGLRVHVVAMADGHHGPGTATAASQSLFRITYSGEVLPGLHRDQVMQRVSQKLRLDETRLARLFSGKAAILKKGLSAEAATSYLAEAAQLGMLARMEIELATAASTPTIAKASANTAQRFMESAVKTQLYSPRAPLYDLHARTSPADDVRTVVDIDLMRSMIEEPVERPEDEPLEEPMPQVKIWRPPVPPETAAADVLPAHSAEPQKAPELALPSIALHVPTSKATPPAPRHKQALRRLAEMGSLLPRALSRILQ